MTEKIELESTFTPYTLDTYSVFTFEDGEEYILESLRDETGEELTYDDIEWSYDCEGYNTALAKNWLTILRENILDDVIIMIESDCKVYSPKEYNFTTDKIFATFTVDAEKLFSFVKNSTEYEKEKLKDADGFIWLGDESQAMLNYYLRKKSTKKLEPFSYMEKQLDDVPAIEYIEYKVSK